MKNILKHIIEKINILINTFKDFAFFIIWILLFPYLLHSLGLGRTLILKLYEDGQQWNLMFVLVAFLLQAIAIWVIPTWVCKIFEKRVNSAYSRLTYFSWLIEYYNDVAVNDGKERKLPIKYFANLPLILFWVLSILDLLGSSYKLPILLVSSIAIYYFLKFLAAWIKEMSFSDFSNISSQKIVRSISAQLDKRFSQDKLLYRKTVVSLAYYALGVGIVLLGVIIIDNSILRLLFILILILLNFSLMVILENLDGPPITDEKTHKFQQYTISKNIALSVYVFFVLLIFSFFLASLQSRLNIISPIFMGIVMISFYTIVFDLIYKSPSILIKRMKEDAKINPSLVEKFGLYSFIMFVLGFFFFYLIIVSPFSTHDLRLEKSEASNYYSPYLQTLDAGLLRNWSDAKRTNTDSVDRYILIAGQGGGSRAGAWMSLLIDSLEHNPSTKGKTFAMSTVSGSSVGAGLYLSKMKLDLVGPKCAKSRLNFIHATFAYNYLSSSFWGFFMHDFIRGLFSGKNDYDKDRNYLEQEEWVNIFTELYPDSSDRIKRTLRDDYKSFWYDGPADSTVHHNLPYLLLNTANVQTGSRHVFSPFLLDSSNPETKVYSRIKQCNPEKSFNLPFITAVHTSELFPLICAYSYNSCYGNFIDGGIYDNSGCNTLYELYENITRLYKTDTILKQRRVAIDIFLCMNTDTRSNGSTNKDVKPENSFLSGAITSLYASPFTGHTIYWYERVKALEQDQSTQIETRVHDIILENTDGLDDDIPLGKVLLKKQINLMQDKFREIQW